MHWPVLPKAAQTSRIKDVRGWCGWWEGTSRNFGGDVRNEISIFQ